MIFESNSAEDTFAFGQKLGREAVPGEIICLDGDLGVGKTVFTQGFAAGLGIDDYVNSPTFNIVKEYEGGRLPLYHFDVYRIGDPSEMEEIGYEDYFYGQGISIIEWPGQIEELLPKEARWVRIRKDLTKGFDYRRIEY
ncbi:MAG: tRNA (adenosine(37)-N6)-threonylcarbamoyltransferase complex ATPase subunit type 1 TsaE [Oribacterium sp.]|nr:tRNA (adenosine(37)-N6)-threonylcarbamoyltransferase complex ATPase subunit type 1 TsaE [Oribacterium sp.]